MNTSGIGFSISVPNIKMFSFSLKPPFLLHFVFLFRNEEKDNVITTTLTKKCGKETDEITV